MFARFGATPARQPRAHDALRARRGAHARRLRAQPGGPAGPPNVAEHLRAGGGRLGTLLGQAGNRQDTEIEEVARVAAEFHPALIVVWARNTEDGQVNGFVVEKGSPGYQAKVIEGKVSLRSVWQAEITLEDVRVPAENKLPGARSFKDTTRVLATTRSTCAWGALGHATAAYDAALRYALERRQFRRAAGQLPDHPACFGLRTGQPLPRTAGHHREDHSNPLALYPGPTSLGLARDQFFRRDLAF